MCNTFAGRRTIQALKKGDKMSKYVFYYDEASHSRKINYKTISAPNYYDNFITMVVGWSNEKDSILQRYINFEKKYADRQDRNGEIKSTMLNQKQFKYELLPLINKMLGL